MGDVGEEVACSASAGFTEQALVSRNIFEALPHDLYSLWRLLVNSLWQLPVNDTDCLACCHFALKGFKNTDECLYGQFSMVSLHFSLGTGVSRQEGELNCCSELDQHFFGFSNHLIHSACN